MLSLLFAGLVLAQDPQPSPVCAEAPTTLAMNSCLMEADEREATRMLIYLQAAIASLREDGADADPEQGIGPEGTIAELNESQALWSAYAQKACAAVYARWEDGTIRNAKMLRCDIDLTHERTRHLWSQYLAYPDDTPPILPEPLELAQ